MLLLTVQTASRPEEKDCLAAEAWALTAHVLYLLLFHLCILFQHRLLAGKDCLSFGFCKSRMFLLQSDPDKHLPNHA